MRPTTQAKREVTARLLTIDAAQYRDVLGRFWHRVQSEGAAECWEYTSPRDRGGYGLFSLAHRITLRAHRFAYEISTGTEIPDGLCILHSCDNPACVNPSHLRVGTRAENMRDCLARGRHPNTNRTHCRKGHLYDERNTGRKPDGSRRCRACDRATRVRYLERKSA